VIQIGRDTGRNGESEMVGGLHGRVFLIVSLLWDSLIWGFRQTII